MALQSLFSAAGPAIGQYLTGEAIKDQTKALQKVSDTAQQTVTQAGQDAATGLAFKPVTVTSGLGRSRIGPEGNVTIEATPQGQAIQNQLQQQALGMTGQAPVTAQSLYNQLQAAQAPELQRQRDSQEARLRAQGRLGLSSSAYGGAPEQLAFEKAVQERQAENFFNAAQLAPQLQGQNLQNIQSSLATSFLPAQQAQGLFNVGGTASQLESAARTAQQQALLNSRLQSAGIGATTGSNIAELASQSDIARANLYGGLFTALAPQVAQATSSAVDAGGNLLGSVGSGLVNLILGSGLFNGNPNTVQDDSVFTEDRGGIGGIGNNADPIFSTIPESNVGIA